MFLDRSKSRVSTQELTFFPIQFMRPSLQMKIQPSLVEKLTRNREVKTFDEDSALENAQKVYENILSKGLA
jgi:hypothetical protein